MKLLEIYITVLSKKRVYCRKVKKKDNCII